MFGNSQPINEKEEKKRVSKSYLSESWPTVCEPTGTVNPELAPFFGVPTTRIPNPAYDLPEAYREPRDGGYGGFSGFGGYSVSASTSAPTGRGCSGFECKRQIATRCCTRCRKAWYCGLKCLQMHKLRHSFSCVDSRKERKKLAEQRAFTEAYLTALEPRFAGEALRNEKALLAWHKYNEAAKETQPQPTAACAPELTALQVEFISAFINAAEP